MKPIVTGILVVFLFLLFPKGVSAQKIRFTDTANSWQTAGGSGTDCEWVRTVRFSIDTVIYGNTYKKVKYVKVKYGATVAGCAANSGMGYFVREDATDNVVYYRLPSYDNQERVLYNYNLVPGDTIQYPDFLTPGGTIADSVVNVDSALIGGVYHKVFDFQNKAGRGSRAYSVIEGIGCVNSPLYPSFMTGCSEYYEHLHCFTQSGLVQDFTMRMNACAEIGYNFYINCDIYPEPTNIPAQSATVAKIYPNPAGSAIEVTFSSATSPQSMISVYDILGRCIFKTGSVQSTSATVNTSSWTNGVYMVVVQDNTGILQKEMVVISH